MTCRLGYTLPLDTDSKQRQRVAYLYRKPQCLRGWELASFVILSLPTLKFLATMLATLPSILRSRAALELENLNLRRQVGVLQRSASKRVKLTPIHRGLAGYWQAKN